CKVSCPCATNKFNPSEGHCDGASVFQIDKGMVGKTKMDGIKIALVFKSPMNRKVMEAFEKGEMDHFATYIDDKPTPKQREAFPKLMEGMFGKMEIKGAKPPVFAPITITSEGDMAKIDVGAGKMTADIENIKIGEIKHGTKTDAKRIKLDGAVPFAFVTGV